MKKADPTRVVLMIGTLALALGVFDAVAAGPGTVTMTVTAVGQKDTSPPLVTKDDVQFFLNKERTQVADWKHGKKLYLAVLIDDSMDSEIASQWSDLKAFLAGQPDPMVSASPGVQAGVSDCLSVRHGIHSSCPKDLRADSPKVKPLGSPPLK